LRVPGVDLGQPCILSRSLLSADLGKLGSPGKLGF
jgi:hypothetical protein